MSASAKGRFASVQSVDAIADFRLATLSFAAEVQGALSEVDADITRLPQWLKLDRVPHWTNQCRKRTADVQAAKRELARKQLMTSPEPHSCVDERKALARAKESLENAEAKLKVTRQWIIRWEQESGQLRSSLGNLRDMGDTLLPRLAARLAKQVDSLQAYAQSQLAPGGPRPSTPLTLASSETAAGGWSAAGDPRGQAVPTSLYSHLRRLAPPPAARGTIGLTDEHGLVGQPQHQLAADDLELLERVALDGLAAKSSDRVLLEPSALSSPVLAMLRGEGAPGESDSGWFLMGPSAAGFSGQALVAATVQTIIEQRPDLTVPLLLPTGMLLVARAGQITSLCLENNEELWR